jgi:hypothetical protein
MERKEKALENFENLSFKEWLETSFLEQYFEQVKILNEMGLLDLLTTKDENGLDQLGIRGIDDREYVLPTEDEIKKVLEGKNREIYETKLKQGFSRLLVTPFATPLERFFKVLEKKLVQHYQEGRLLEPKINSQDPDVPLKLKIEEPVVIYPDWRGSDTSGKCIYNDSSYQGKTKKDILESPSVFCGFKIFLLEKNLIIPGKGQGKTIRGRWQLEAGYSAQNYLETLQDSPIYVRETSLSFEDWITLFLTQLEKTNEVIDLMDYNGYKGVACLLPTSSYQTTFGLAFYDFRGQRVELHWRAPWQNNSEHGFRSGVLIQ